MSIQPHFEIGKKKRKYYANKEFTDREEQRNEFINIVNNINLEKSKLNEYFVLFFYGVGGIGKSSLVKQLKIDLINKYPNASYSSVDFIDPPNRQASRALLELKKNIFEKKRFKLPHFDLAYSIYFKKRNPEYVFNEKNLPFEEEASIIGDILGAFDGLGIAGAVTGMISKAYKTLSKYGLKKEVKKDLTNLENCSTIEIENLLPAFFAYDVNNAIQKKKISSFVIFIDTYEALWSDNKTESNKYAKDSWIRELISHLPNILFVISGREKLRWEEIDPEWLKALNQYLLNNFTKNDADLYLKTCGVEGQEIRAKILAVSDGHPYHLDLSVDTYYELKNTNSTISQENFASNKRQVLDRFIRNLEKSEIETLKLLSIARYYNEEIFDLLIKFFETGYSLTQFEDFNRFSFIRVENERYFIHDLMRDSLKQILLVSLLNKTHNVLADYYDGKLSKKESFISQDEVIELFSEASYHRLLHLNKNDYQKWLSENRYHILKNLQLRGAANFLEEFLTDISSQIGIDSLGINLFIILVDMIHLKGNYQNAVYMIDSFLEDYDQEMIFSSDELLHLYIRKVHHQMFYLPVLPLIDDLLKVTEKVNVSFLPDRYNELLFMLGGNLGVLSGDLKFSLNWIKKSIKFSQDNNLQDFLCRSLRKYSDILRYYGKLKDANKICNWGLNIAKDNDYKRYEIYLLCSKAEIFREMKLYNKSINLYKEAKQSAKQQGIKGWIAHTHLGIAENLLRFNDIDLAINEYHSANDIYKKINQHWGQVQVNIGFTRCFLLKKNKKWENLALNALKHSDKMGYKKDSNLLKKMLKDKNAYNNKLLFL